MFMDTDNKTYKSMEQIEKIFKDKGVDLSKPIIASCGSGEATAIYFF
jgi:3-mercaptopyruvate sulfurtransferase SseA